MYLIYVNEIGTDFKNQKQYQFIFSKQTEFDMEGWFVVPASSSHNYSPDGEYIDSVYLLKDTDIIFDLIQNSDYFGMIDSVDGVVAMAWEKSEFDSELYNRLYFRFGETFESVIKKLKERDVTLIKENFKYV